MTKFFVATKNAVAFKGGGLRGGVKFLLKRQNKKAFSSSG